MIPFATLGGCNCDEPHKLEDVDAIGLTSKRRVVLDLRCGAVLATVDCLNAIGVLK